MSRTVKECKQYILLPTAKQIKWQCSVFRAQWIALFVPFRQIGKGLREMSVFSFPQFSGSNSKRKEGGGFSESKTPKRLPFGICVLSQLLCVCTIHQSLVHFTFLHFYSLTVAINQNNSFLRSSLLITSILLVNLI